MVTPIPFKYSLDNTSKKHVCPKCLKRRFVRYRNNETGNYLPEDVGRCDRELECGYHKTPRNKGRVDICSSDLKRQLSQKVSALPLKYLERSLDQYKHNALIQWLATLPGWDYERSESVARIYRVGTTKDGWAIFWQVDENGKVRSGKMMKYDPTGCRVKDEYSQDWVHSRLQKAGKLNNFELVQCFYGLHLVDDQKPVAIVESEKTAIIASQYLPQFYWIASGMLQGINEFKLRPLRGRPITLFPDIGAYDLWNEKASQFGYMANIQVSDLLECRAPDKHRGHDLADYLVRFDLRDFTAPNGWNPYTNEVFDNRGYPVSWDEDLREESQTFQNMIGASQNK